MNVEKLAEEEVRRAVWFLRPWHAIRIRLLRRKMRRERRELAKFVRRSAYEITAWRQDITFLQEQLDYHLLRKGVRVAEEAAPLGDNVVKMPLATPTQPDRKPALA